MLSFSGAYLLGLTALHLLPEAFHDNGYSVGYWILAGFFLQLILELFSKGIEHGHIHPSHAVNWSFATQLMIGLCLHAFFEGLPLSGYSDFHDHMHHSESHFNSFLLGILLHKLPAAFALASVLVLTGFKKQHVLLMLIIFASMSPLGGLVGAYLDLESADFQKLLGLIVGTFLHISTTILFENDESSHHQVSFYKLLAIGLGVGLAMLTT
ncbi:MAG: ZIP family metal transporter [Saprospiraceae bacterium]